MSVFNVVCLLLVKVYLLVVRLRSLVLILCLLTNIVFFLAGISLGDPIP